MLQCDDCLSGANEYVVVFRRFHIKARGHLFIVTYSSGSENLSKLMSKCWWCGLLPAWSLRVTVVDPAHHKDEMIRHYHSVTHHPFIYSSFLQEIYIDMDWWVYLSRKQAETDMWLSSIEDKHQTNNIFKMILLSVFVIRTNYQINRIWSHLGYRALGTPVTDV